MEGVNYPYLGKKSYKNKNYVVLFIEENYGLIVMSEIDDVEELKFGRLGEFSESVFEFLPPEECVRLSN